MAKRVLVTGIGGNVGQGVLRTIRREHPEVGVIGTDIAEATAGHHFCDAFYQVPYCYKPEYETALRAACEREAPDLIIPCTDHEAYHIGLLSGLPPLLASPPEVTGAFLDKYKTFQLFSERGIPFAASRLPSEYGGEFGEVVVKPREGRGSREVHFGPEDPTAFEDRFVVQERARGPELTVAFYVTGDRRVLGPIAFRRRLANGATERCAVTFERGDALAALAGQVAALGIVGPCNIQLIAEEGRLVPFEINCRYSGTVSIRGRFGFRDVVYGLREHLFGERVEAEPITRGSAIRLLVDVIFPEAELEDLSPGADHSYVS